MALNDEIKFAEWIAESHYILCDVSDAVYTWSNEIDKKTTNELYEMFLNTDNHYKKCR